MFRTFSFSSTSSSSYTIIGVFLLIVLIYIYLHVGIDRSKSSTELFSSKSTDSWESSTFLDPRRESRKVAALHKAPILGESEPDVQKVVELPGSKVTTLPLTDSSKSSFMSFSSPSSESKKRYQIVLARYQENINYILTSYFRDFDIVIYNKGSEITSKDILKRCTVIDVPNVGKCDHTYLYHIIQNYDSLADVTIFLPASFYHLHYKRFRAMQLLKQVQETGNSVYPCEPIQDVDVKYAKYTDMKKNRYILELEYYFKMNEYKTAYHTNQNASVDRDMLHSPLRPFYKWYMKHFPNKKCPYLFYWGIFAASRQDIRKNPLTFYQELASYLDHHPNPEVGHYMERSWASVFYPFPRHCILQTHP